MNNNLGRRMTDQPKPDKERDEKEVLRRIEDKRRSNDFDERIHPKDPTRQTR